MYPSTCGLIVAECRDFRIDRYSVVSGIFSSCATRTWTGIAGGAPPAAADGSPAEVFPQPAVKTPVARNTVTKAVAPASVHHRCLSRPLSVPSKQNLTDHPPLHASPTLT